MNIYWMQNAVPPPEFMSGLICSMLTRHLRSASISNKLGAYSPLRRVESHFQNIGRMCCGSADETRALSKIVES